METIEIEIPDELLVKLNAAAEKRSITLNKLLNEILRQYLIEMERVKENE